MEDALNKALRKAAGPELATAPNPARVIFV
jgi:hypothetical protein